jgi:hypothetical protein
VESSIEADEGYMKRKTKEQRDTEAKAALRQRVHDIACGAAGYQFDEDDQFATADFLSRFIPALKAQFGFDDTKEKAKDGLSNNYLFDVQNLDNYDNVDTTTDFLFEHGVRG